MQIKIIEKRQREDAKAEQERLSKERDQEKSRAQKQLAEAEAKHMASLLNCNDPFGWGITDMISAE